MSEPPRESKAWATRRARYGLLGYRWGGYQKLREGSEVFCNSPKPVFLDGTMVDGGEYIAMNDAALQQLLKARFRPRIAKAMRLIDAREQAR